MRVRVRVQLSRRSWRVGQAFCKDLGSLLLRNALHLLEGPSRGVGDGLDGLKAAVDNQLDITLRETRETLFLRRNVD